MILAKKNLTLYKRSFNSLIYKCAKALDIYVKVCYNMSTDSPTRHKSKQKTSKSVKSKQGDDYNEK